MIKPKFKKRVEKKIFEVKMMEKIKLKMTTVLIVALFVIIAIVTPNVAAYAKYPKHPKLILVMSKGYDADIVGGTTSIIAMIKFDKASGLPSVAQLEFQTKIYDESGEKIYSIKGKLKDGLVIGGANIHQFHCDVRNVTWVNLWFITGEGKLKTTDADITMEFRGQIITLPNTGGKYIPFSFWMFVNPKGEYISDNDPDQEIQVWPEGGWASVLMLIDGIPTFSVTTYLTRYMEI
jgi:hypothetical protein